MKFNFRKISAIASSALMVGMTVGIAAAASYPAPFISGGTSDVAIVYGTGAGVSALDQTQAFNINIDLQSRTGGTSGSSGSVTGGDSVLLAKGSDNLNLGNTWGVFTGSVDDDDLTNLLADGTYAADDNDEFDYEQKITLGTPTLTHFRDSDFESIAGLTARTPTVGFKISSNTFIMNYTLDFTQDAESDIVSGDMDDIEGSDIPLLGKTYFVSDLKNGTDATIFGKMTLLDSATVSSVSEGETVTVQSGGNSYEVGISYIDNDEVTFLVNGEKAPKTGKLQKGETYRLSDNSYIGARDISKLEVSGELGNADFSIGAGKLEITSGSNIKLNDDTIEGVKGYVYRGTASSGAEQIDKVEINWVNDEEEFLAPGQDLLLPGFGGIKFTMNPLVRPEEEKVVIEKDSDTSVALTVPIKDGTVDFNILFTNSTSGGNFSGLGKDVDERLATSSGNTVLYYEKFNGNDYHKYFVASYNISQEAESYLLRATVSEDSTNGRNETTIQKATGLTTWTDVCEEKKASDTCDMGLVSLTISEINWTSGGNESVLITAGADTHFNTIYTKGGLRIYLPYLGGNESTTQGLVNFTSPAPGTAGHNEDTFLLFMDGEDKDENIAGGVEFNVTINDNSDDNLQVSQVSSGGTGGPNGLEQGDTSVYETYIVDDVAPRILHYTNPDEDWAEVYYPGGSDSETYAEVFITEESATVTAGSAGTGGVAQLGNIVFKDNEQSSWSSNNVIIVGGSCINSAAATALGVGSGTCGSGFTDATGVGSGQYLIQSVDGAFTSGKVALVVAGYEVDNTVAAASYLTNVGVDTAAGNKYIGTSATQATLEVEQQ